MSYNKIILTGNLTSNPEMRYVPSGDAVTSFTLAVNQYGKNEQGEKADQTMWVRVSIFGKQAENANTYLKKGNKALVEGRLQFDAKTGNPRMFDRKDGTTGCSFEVMASSIEYLTPKNEGSNGDKAVEQHMSADGAQSASFS